MSWRRFGRKHSQAQEVLRPGTQPASRQTGHQSGRATLVMLNLALRGSCPDIGTSVFAAIHSPLYLYCRTPVPERHKMLYKGPTRQLLKVCYGHREGSSAASDGPVLLTWAREASSLDAVRRRADEAAKAAAVSNADPSRAVNYNSQGAPSSDEQSLQASVAVATAAGVAKVRTQPL